MDDIGRIGLVRRLHGAVLHHAGGHGRRRTAVRVRPPFLDRCQVARVAADCKGFDYHKCRMVWPNYEAVGRCKVDEADVVKTQDQGETKQVLLLL